MVGINKLLVRISNREDPDQTASIYLLRKQSEQWFCAVCLGLLDMQLAIKILEHIPYLIYFNKCSLSNYRFLCIKLFFKIYTYAYT